MSITATELLNRIPPAQREVAAGLIAQYGPRLLDMAIEDAWVYIRRLQAGDLDAVSELDGKLSDAEWLASVKVNTARWNNVAGYNVVRDNLKNEILLKIAPIVLAILAGVVGL